jgi:AcrR family transcriptional regulator
MCKTFLLLPPKENMEARKEEIINRTLALFEQRGIRSLSMAEISSLQHISKKTLYLYFKDKNDLVKECLRYELDRISSKLEEIAQKSLNAIDESYEISEFVIQRSSDLHPMLFLELKSYYPEAFNLFEEHQEECIAKSVIENLHKGVKEGLYRPDLKVDFITNLYVSTIFYLFTTHLANTHKYSFSEVYYEFFKYHIRGISSSKGLQFLQTNYRNYE